MNVHYSPSVCGEWKGGCGSTIWSLCSVLRLRPTGKRMQGCGWQVKRVGYHINQHWLIHTEVLLGLWISFLSWLNRSLVRGPMYYILAQTSFHPTVMTIIHRLSISRGNRRCLIKVGYTVHKKKKKNKKSRVRIGRGSYARLFSFLF